MLSIVFKQLPREKEKKKELQSSDFFASFKAQATSIYIYTRHIGQHTHASNTHIPAKLALVHALFSFLNPQYTQTLFRFFFYFDFPDTFF